jgi:hypothetical protein
LAFKRSDLTKSFIHSNLIFRYIIIIQLRRIRDRIRAQGVASPFNVIGGVASSFQQLSGGGDRDSRMLFAGERGGGRNATAAKLLK